MEDHRWWWRSFLCGGSTALFVYGYCFYYYYARSGMSGFMQTSYFFGYNLVVSGRGSTAQHSTAHHRELHVRPAGMHVCWHGV